MNVTRSIDAPLSMAPTSQEEVWNAPSVDESDKRSLPGYEYDAFISYRRGDAAALAQWIRNGLQRFRLPAAILSELSAAKQELHKRRPRVWLDTSYEKSSDDFLQNKVFP